MVYATLLIDEGHNVNVVILNWTVAMATDRLSSTVAPGSVVVAVVPAFVTVTALVITLLVVRVLIPLAPPAAKLEDDEVVLGTVMADPVAVEVGAIDADASVQNSAN